MRLRINAISRKCGFIPLNYQYQLQSAIYDLIRRSSEKYADFLHEKGYANLQSTLKHFKLFTFSRLKLRPYLYNRNGFWNVQKIEFVFSSASVPNYEHLVYGIFSEMSFRLQFADEALTWDIREVQSLPEPEFSSPMKLRCLSPITVSSRRDKPDGGSEVHFLEYLNPDEKDRYVANLHRNLIRKYEVLYQKSYDNDAPFNFVPDPDYLISRFGKVSKLIRFKNGVNIKALEVPFTVSADPELIKIGYQCGFGEKNSAGFGCVEEIG